jgi:hypothetical protein
MADGMPRERTRDWRPIETMPLPAAEVPTWERLKIQPHCGQGIGSLSGTDTGSDGRARASPSAMKDEAGPYHESFMVQLPL